MDGRTTLQGVGILVLGLVGCHAPEGNKSRLDCIRPGQTGSLIESIRNDRTAPYITTAAEAAELAKPEVKADEPSAPPKELPTTNPSIAPMNQVPPASPYGVLKRSE
jgi:hypothetical protein